MLIKSLNLKENKIRSHFISYHIYWTTIGALFRYLYFPLSLILNRWTNTVWQWNYLQGVSTEVISGH